MTDKLYEMDIEYREKPTFNDYYGSTGDVIQRVVHLPKGDCLLVREKYTPFFDESIGEGKLRISNITMDLIEFDPKDFTYTIIDPKIEENYAGIQYVGGIKDGKQ